MNHYSGILERIRASEGLDSVDPVSDPEDSETASEASSEDPHEAYFTERERKHPSMTFNGMRVIDGARVANPAVMESVGAILRCELQLHMCCPVYNRTFAALINSDDCVSPVFPDGFTHQVGVFNISAVAPDWPEPQSAYFQFNLPPTHDNAATTRSICVWRAFHSEVVLDEEAERKLDASYRGSGRKASHKSYKVNRRTMTCGIAVCSSHRLHGIGCAAQGPLRQADPEYKLDEHSLTAIGLDESWLRGLDSLGGFLNPQGACQGAYTYSGRLTPSAADGAKSRMHLCQLRFPDGELVPRGEDANDWLAEHLAAKPPRPQDEYPLRLPLAIDWGALPPRSEGELRAAREALAEQFPHSSSRSDELAVLVLPDHDARARTFSYSFSVRCGRHLAARPQHFPTWAEIAAARK